MKLNRKLWTAALAVAMTTPSAMAAQDTAGMHYTSAAEGFYASIRARYVSSGGNKDGGSDLQNSSSRFGVRGTNDLGSGLEGFYQYEAGVGIDNGSGLSTRLGLVGLRGDFGSVVAGSFWTDTYNWVYGSTDIANRHSGYFAYGEFGQGRSKKSLQYTTPDLNGFRGAFLIQADSSKDGEGDSEAPTEKTLPGKRTEVRSMEVTEAGVTLSATRTTLTFEVPGGPAKEGNKDDSDIDHWSLAAAYDIAGFSMGLSYSVFPDAIAGLAKSRNSEVNAAAKKLGYTITDPFDTKKDDLTAWALKLGYSQDNWYVNSWYGQEGTGDIGAVKYTDSDGDAHSYSISDNEVFSIAGGISVDKVAVYALYENKEYNFPVNKVKDDGYKYDNHIRGDDSYYTLGVQYTLGSNSWTWVEYAGRDLDSSENEDSDFSIGLGHSF